MFPKLWKCIIIWVIILLSLYFWSHYRKKRGADTLFLIGGRRKTMHTNIGITVHAIRAEPLCSPCVLLKISYVPNHQTSITLLFSKCLDNVPAIAGIVTAKVMINFD